jgi:hypothetical protein
MIFLFVLLVVAGMCFAVSTSTPWTIRYGTLVQASGLLLAALWLVRFVQSEDSYRDDGTSRWMAYGAHDVTVTAVAMAVVAALLLVGARVAGRRWFTILAFVLSMPAAAWLGAATAANSLN